MIRNSSILHWGIIKKIFSRGCLFVRLGMWTLLCTFTNNFIVFMGYIISTVTIDRLGYYIV